MSSHLDALSRFIANQFLFLFFKAAYSAEKQQVPMVESLVLSDHDSNPRSTALQVATLRRIMYDIFQFMMILFVKLTKGIGHTFCQLMKSSPINTIN